MRYLMRQKWLSWGDDFHIQDQDGNDVYFVDGHVLTWGDKFSFQNLQGHELAFVEQQVFSWGPTYHVSLGGLPYATVKKELFTFFHCKFEVDVPGPDDLLAEGDFLEHEYTFTRHGEVVASVSKKWFTWTDTYGIDISPGQSDVLVLAAAVVIDLVCHDNRNH